MPIEARLVLALLLALAPSASFAEENDEGFVSLFDGQTLAGWDGDTTLWSVEDGAITGRTSADAPIQENQFLIWDGEVRDFELRLQFCIDDAGAKNSGVQYRAKRFPDVGPWIVGGYQADIEATNKYMGILYEERGRGIIAMPGQDVVIRPDGDGFKRDVVGSVGEPSEIFAGVRAGEWQDYRIIARGNELTHMIDGKVVAHVVDEDEKNAAASGVLALQVHRGGPMCVQFRNLRLKRLDAAE